MTKTELKSRLKETIRAELEMKLSDVSVNDVDKINLIRAEIVALDNCDTLGNIFILLHTLGYLVDDVLHLVFLSVLDGDEISLIDERMELIPEVWEGPF